MATEKRLIDANALLEKIQFRMAIDNKNAEIIAGCVDITRRLIENAPTVDAVELPKGKPGDYVKWATGVNERILEIHAVVICKDGIRYDLGDIFPFVNHSHIMRIMNREEAEREVRNAVD